MSWVLNRPAHVAYASDQTDAINEAAQPPANQLYIMFVKDVVPQDYVIKVLDIQDLQNRTLRSQDVLFADCASYST